MIERALRAMGDPEAFFHWLAGEAENLRRAFLVVLIGALVSSAGGFAILYVSDMPEALPLRGLFDDAGLTPRSVAIGLLLAAPIGGLVTWAFAWIPIRLGAGAAPRLWEVAAWCQVPAIVLATLQLALVVSFPVSPALGSGLSAIGVFWCAWFVYAGVRVLSEGHAIRAAVFYLLYGILLPVFNLLMQSSVPAPSGSPGIVG